MSKFAEALLKYGKLTVRTYDDGEWTVEHLSSYHLKEFVILIDTLYDESMYKLRGLGLLDLYLN